MTVVSVLESSMFGLPSLVDEATKGHINGSNVIWVTAANIGITLLETAFVPLYFVASLISLVAFSIIGLFDESYVPDRNRCICFTGFSLTLPVILFCRILKSCISFESS